MKFYRCKKCGQIVGMVKDTGVPMICCGSEMEAMTPYSNDNGLGEKHVPVYKLKRGQLEVNIGSIPHPMISDHYIEWVAIVTNKGNQRKCLKPGDAPIVKFFLDKDETPREIFVYCNLHSLWVKKIEQF